MSMSMEKQACMSIDTLYVDVNGETSVYADRHTVGRSTVVPDGTKYDLDVRGTTKQTK